MKIIDISIRQFLGLESLDLHLQAPINVIIGENEAGKSSVRDAIQWCLSGQARGLKTQQEQAALIRDGGKAAEVSLTFADGRTGTRRKTPKSTSTFSGPEDLGLILSCSQLTINQPIETGDGGDQILITFQRY